MVQHTDSNQPEVQRSERNGSIRHKTVTLSDGTPIGRIGAYWYVFNEEGQAISDGYLDISRNEKGEYTGKRSARSEQIVLPTESLRNS